MSGNKITALIVVAILHVLLAWALVSGLAFEGMKKIVQKVTAVEIKKEEKKKEEPPPPKKDIAPPPIVAPPPKMNLPVPAAPIQSVPVAPPPPPIPIPVAVPPPAAPPPPQFTAKGAVPRGNPGNWATTNDYPSRALREEREGTTGFRVTVGTDGRVTGCTITSSSGHGDLDEATCSNVTRRARFTPATDGNGNPTTGSYSSRVRWVIPKD